MTEGLLKIWSLRAEILDAFGSTILLTLVGGLCALAAGLLLALTAMSRRRAVQRAVTVYIDTMRCVPFLLFVYLLYFGLPTLGFRMSNWEAGALAILMYHSAYMAEVLRAAIRQLPRDILESATSFGYVGWPLARRIIIPPALLRSIPLVGNQFVQILKDTALLTVIAVTELTHALTGIQSTYFIPVAAYLTAVLLYWALCVTIELTASRLELLARKRRA
jgi:polar amino acid transport system permease protein